MCDRPRRYFQSRSISKTPMSESARLPTHSQDTNSSSHSHYSCRKCVGTHNKQSNLITSSSIRRLRGFLFSILSDYNIYHLLQPFIFSCYSHSISQQESTNKVGRKLPKTSNESFTFCPRGGPCRVASRSLYSSTSCKNTLKESVL